MGHPRQEERGQRQQERDRQVGQVEEGDRRRGRRRSAPTASPRRCAASPSRSPASAGATTNGAATRYGASRISALRGARSSSSRPPATTQASAEQREDREEEEVERRQQRAEQPGQADEPRAIAPAGGALAGRRQAGDEQQHRADQHRQPGGRGAMGEQPGAHDRRDAEVRPAGQPLVVVAVVRDEVGEVAGTDRRAHRGRGDGQVTDEPDPAEAAGEDHERSREEAARRARRPAQEPAGEREHEQCQCPGEDRGLDDHGGDREEAGGLGQDRGVEVGEPVIDERLAGEVRNLRREVAAGVQRLGDREVDAEVAPVRAARAHAVGRHAPDAGAEDDADHRGGQGGHGERRCRRRRARRLGVPTPRHAASGTARPSSAATPKTTPRS